METCNSAVLTVDFVVTNAEGKDEYLDFNEKEEEKTSVGNKIMASRMFIPNP